MTANGLAEELAEVVQRGDLTVAVAESLTAGQIAAALGAAPESAEWFRGGVVAYSAQVKRSVLGVPEVPVVSETAAKAMAEGVTSLMGSTLSVAVTGVGGPGPQDGEPAGSVWFSVAGKDVTASHRQFDGSPEEVLEQTVNHALELLLEAARGH
ncbi:CinA family protein [Nocardia iowensis]|uniref:CinA family protein n=1 Tax=Nocardia iowensis TaxID=204891 RepID=A0ABX8RKY9_NOCIO|nr:CinA family protein [Nocardia iowensis]QXN90238.1 CinA family protein [Nocardia iowensis]